MTSNQVRKHFKNAREQMWSIPNILSYVRFLLIPVFIVLYVKGHGMWAFATLVLSGLTDILDGWVARKFDMVTNLGKFIDPLADKVTQAAMILCVGLRFPNMLFLLAIHIAKELVMLYLGYRVLDKTGTTNSAMWYGKMCTATLYVVMALHIVWPAIPVTLSNVLLFVCGGMIIFCLVMYWAYFNSIIAMYDKQVSEDKRDGGD